MNNLDDIIRKVQGLIAKADASEFPAEAETFRNKAEALMLQYRIEESNLTAEAKMVSSLTVEWRTIVICDMDSEFRSAYASMMYECIRHFDCRYDFCRAEIREETSMLVTVKGTDYVIEVCGYESDLRFIEMMFTSAALVFAAKLEPKYDPTLSDQINAYNMRSAGMEGRRIAMAIYGRDDKALRPKVRKMFESESIKRGEDPKVLLGRGSNMVLFRQSYSQGFTETFGHRLREMRVANLDGGLVLASRKEAINEAFYVRFPERRPKPVNRQLGEHQIGTCPKCAKAASGYCRDHGWMRPRKGPVRYANGAALRRGAAAARSVNMGVTGRSIG